MCNSLFLSNPRISLNINKGNLYQSESFGVVFDNPEKVAYTNDYTYKMMPISFVDKDFSIYEFQNKSPDEVGVKKLIFNPGEAVFVGNCLSSFEMIEINMTDEDIEKERERAENLEAKNLKKTSNFNIPISTNEAIELESAPTLKDSLFSYIVFQSPAVVFRNRDGRGGYDNVNRWVLSLSLNRFEMQSQNYSEDYSVIDAKFHEELRMQEFQLADQTGNFTHTLYISYNNSSDSYRVIFNSTDNKDEFQFQNISLNEIEYQR